MTIRLRTLFEVPSRHLLLIISLLCAATSTPAALAVQHRDDVPLEQRAALVLTQRCLSCHHATEAQGAFDMTQRATALRGGESGPAIVPSDSEASLLWQRIAANEMPPKNPLPKAEQEIIRSWIAAGAQWHRERLDPFAFTTDSRAGYDWWSLQPLAQSNLRYVAGGENHPIDIFIDAKLRSVGLQRSQAAARSALVRRLYVDLHGLPPTPAQLDAFLSDSRPNAVERLIDQLLEAPEYGQQWARHWLDVARFGESQGFERDKLRTNSWRYRDWVVAALNRDMPYDEFARMQLAGDLLKPGDVDALIATGFLVAAPWDEVGQKQQSAAMREVVRQDELEDLVSVVSQTFLGLTANCARCHDHKFDPIQQREYYQLAAALAGVQHGEPVIPASAVLIGLGGRQAVYEDRIAVLNKQIEAIDSEARQRILQDRSRQRTLTVVDAPKPIASWEFESKSERELSVGLLGGAQLSSGRLVLNGQGYAVSQPLNIDLSEKTIEVWVQLGPGPQSGGGAMSVESLNGEIFDAIVFGEKEPERWMAGSNGFARTQSLKGPPERDAQGRVVHLAIVYEASGKVIAYREGRSYGESYQTSGPVAFKAGQAHVLFGLQHSPVSPSRLLRGSIERARLYDRALTADEVAASAGVESHSVSESEILVYLAEEVRQLRDDLRFEREQLLEHQRRATDRKVYAVDAKQPPAMHVLLRGNPSTPSEQVAAGGIAAISGVSANFAVSQDASDAQRRTQLAHWITDRDNPLFARVIVNRVWHYHFGTGLMATPNDFGFNGGQPSHSELLDWLAAELIRNKWSLKHLHRCILNSSTYQQASLFRDDAARVDQDNRLLWRMSPRRLDAENLRDAILQFSGKLDRSLGGPGFYEFSTHVHNSQFYEARDPIGATFERRALYRTWVRSSRNIFLDAFDCPDPSIKARQRAVTTTPLQSLSLLNNSFVLRMADALAQRAAAAYPMNPERQLVFIFREVLGREPETEELSLSVRFAADNGLPAICRVLFNSNELLYLD